MEKIIIYFAIFWFAISSALFGQSKAVSGTFEDITFIDIEGNTHRPYDYLEAGKVVIIDVFATWCVPCWNFHEEGHLQNIYQTYGPEGTDQLMVFYVEGDLNTFHNDLAGTGDNTLGNYITCSPYPLIDNHFFPFDLGITNFPTLLFICPDKQISEIGQLNEDQIVDLLETNCPAPNYSNNADLLYYSSNEDPACGEIDYLPKVIVQNNSSNSISHISLQYEVNGTVIVDSIGYDVFLNTYETTELPLPVTTISSTTDFQISILSVNEFPDSNDLYNTVHSEKEFITTEAYELELQIETDNFGYETYWKVENDMGNIIATGGNELVIPGGQQGVAVLTGSVNYYQSNANILDFIPLNEPGCYTFTIQDDWGDGLCCSIGASGFELIEPNGNKLIKNVDFLNEYAVTFEVAPIAAGVDDLETVISAKAYPNPAIDQVNIDFEALLSEKVDFNIYNQLGKLISNFEYETVSGNNQLLLDVSAFSNGTYFIKGSHHLQSLSIPIQILRP